MNENVEKGSIGELVGRLVMSIGLPPFGVLLFLIPVKDFFFKMGGVVAFAGGIITIVFLVQEIKRDRYKNMSEISKDINKFKKYIKKMSKINNKYENFFVGPQIIYEAKNIRRCFGKEPFIKFIKDTASRFGIKDIDLSELE
jgi:cellobiose-specific phosphotransferase system component IIB